MQSAQQRADSLKTEGNKAFESRQFTKAAKIYRDAIKLDPENSVLYANRAQCFLRLSDFCRALRDSENGLELAQNDNKIKVKLMFRMALAHKGLESFESARECFKNVLAWDPSNKAATLELELLPLPIVSKNKHRIKVTVVDMLPLDLSLKREIRGAEIENSETAPSPPTTEADSLSQDFSAFGSRGVMKTLLALKSTSPSQKQAAYKLVTELTGEELTQLFGKGTAGVEPEFLEFLLEAMADISDRTVPCPQLENFYKSLELLQKMPRFMLSLAFCDHRFRDRLLDNVARDCPSLENRYRAVLS